MIVSASVHLLPNLDESPRNAQAHGVHWHADISIPPTRRYVLRLHCGGSALVDLLLHRRR